MLQLHDTVSGSTSSPLMHSFMQVIFVKTLNLQTEHSGSSPNTGIKWAGLGWAGGWVGWDRCDRGGI